VERGVPTFVRYSRGRDVMAACGQLALLQIDSSLVVRGQSAVKKRNTSQPDRLLEGVTDSLGGRSS